MCLGAVAAAASGISLPLFAFIFGEMMDSFGPGKTLNDVLAAASL